MSLFLCLSVRLSLHLSFWPPPPPPLLSDRRQDHNFTLDWPGLPPYCRSQRCLTDACRQGLPFNEAKVERESPCVSLNYWNHVLTRHPRTAARVHRSSEGANHGPAKAHSRPPLPQPMAGLWGGPTGRLIPIGLDEVRIKSRTSLTLVEF